MASISKTQRWLDLIACLVGRRFPVAVDELMEKVPVYAEKWVGGSETDRASARCAFERDKGELAEVREEGAAVRRFEVRQVDPFLRWVLSLEGDAEILGPPEIRWLVRKTAGRVAAGHGEGGAPCR